MKATGLQIRLEILLDYKSSGKWFLLSAAIGLVAGFGAIAFSSPAKR